MDHFGAKAEACLRQQTKVCSTVSFVAQTLVCFGHRRLIIILYMKKSYKKNYLSKKSNRRQNKPGYFERPVEEKTVGDDKPKRKIEIPSVLSVKEFSERSNIPASEIISELFKSGVLATINDSIDYDTAAIVGDDLGLDISKAIEDESQIKKTEIISDQKNLKPRYPIVTIMGHVDHGKTTLLDRIRQSHIADSESGGITQHISAYQVTLSKVNKKNILTRTITFIDTPGHAAFSALRSHGTAITDIVVLIVSAADGVMPQTVEVINQAKENNVPIIVAINKVDLPDANIEKVKNQLSEHDLVTEEWGGKTVMVPISAKTGQGIEELLEMILLQADLMELKANPDTDAVGFVIESHMHKGAGALSIVLIANGTLNLGDPIQVGSTWGKVRIMENFLGEAIEHATPSMPVRIAGLRAMPTFGDQLIVYNSEKEAREASKVSQKKNNVTNISTFAKKVSKEGEEEKEEDKIELKVIIKADVLGSLEAIKKMISEIDVEEANIKIIFEGIGAISESDVTLAETTNGQVYGFRVKTIMLAKKIAEKTKVKIKNFDVIYELIDDIKNELSNLLPPLIKEEETGKGTVLAIFREDRKGVVIGAKLEDGNAERGHEIKIFQDENEKWRGKMQTLRKEKDEVKEVSAGQEFGIGLDSLAKVSVGDKFVVFNTISEKRTIK